MSDQPETPAPEEPIKHKRRPRYSGKNPRRFEDKYKEHNPERYADTVAKVLESGKTPAGTHRPIMVDEILQVLALKPGDTVADCTLGFGGHARALLEKITPDGRLIGLDADPIELPKTEERLRALGYGPDVVSVHRSNFAGLPKILADCQVSGVDIILADLGVSSMQLDNPARGFTTKGDGPLDMRMNPQRGQTAADLLKKVGATELETLLTENADEPHAHVVALALAGKAFVSTKPLAEAIRATFDERRRRSDDADLTVRRVFQALRIAVNDEFSALDTFLRNVRYCLNPGGRIAVLTFHSGEDRRVKKSFEAGLADGFYSDIAHEVIRPSAEERRANPRSSPAKLRWARAA
ncbi:MAG: 16S rRNA (cytosine(1402)-N(4))-methyltransferase RsmH [Limisphaerales bacterium]